VIVPKTNRVFRWLRHFIFSVEVKLLREGPAFAA
jgi:hypothetical protein